jgi:nucleoid-associated protein YgaU
MADKEKTPAKDNPYAQYHVVQKGDTLSKIAKDYYGDMTLYPKIFEANKDVLTDPNKIKPGQKLLIP